MQLNNLFKLCKPEEPETKAPEAEQAAPVSTKTCPRCQAELTTAELEAQEYVCTCGYHFRMPAPQAADESGGRGQLLGAVAGHDGRQPYQLYQL